MNPILVTAVLLFVATLGGGVLRVQTRSPILLGPLAGLVALPVLLVLLTITVGLGVRGWLVGVASGVLLTVLLTRSMTRHRRLRLGPADRVTLTRAVITCAVAALTADALDRDAAVPVLVGLSTLALMLDGVDGRIARRTRTSSAFGARFDMEVDAALILVLSIYVARDWGWWVLSLGLARYLFLGAGRVLPWLRAAPPPRRWAKVVAVIVGVVLIVASAGVLPDPVSGVALVVAVGLLVESFGRSVWDLWRLRGGGPFPRSAVTAALALLLVWGVLLLPDRVEDLGPGAFLRIPVEGVVLLACAVVLPGRPARILAVVGGLALAVLTVLRLLDMGFRVAFSAPFHLVNDTAYAGAGVALLADSVGRVGAAIALAGIAVLLVALFTLLPLSAVRLTRLAASRRGAAMRVLAGSTVIAIAATLAGAQVGPAGAIASTTTAQLAVAHATQVRHDLADQREFAAALGQEDPFHGVPDDQLLTGLRGKDVLLVFVESYGARALQLPAVSAALDAGAHDLRQAGFSARSGFLTSPTFGGLSWLAHSTLQSGLWIDNQSRYDRVVSSDRLTLMDAFGRAGWRTVIDVPAAEGDWPEATTFYRADHVYDRENVGYAGPGFTWGAMPDQYTLAAFQRLELRPVNHPPVMAQINLVSSHWPWPAQPPLVDWSAVGDGSVYASSDAAVEATSETPEQALRDAGRMTNAYDDAIAYSLRAVTSFVQQLHDPNVLLVVLGDHQPASLVAGAGASRDVPVSIIASDPDVLARTAAWGWQPGLSPGADAPVWPMGAFRDIFLTTFGNGSG